MHFVSFAASFILRAALGIYIIQYFQIGFIYKNPSFNTIAAVAEEDGGFSAPLPYLMSFYSGILNSIHLQGLKLQLLQVIFSLSSFGIQLFKEGLFLRDLHRQILFVSRLRGNYPAKSKLFEVCYFLLIVQILYFLMITT